MVIVGATGRKATPDSAPGIAPVGAFHSLAGQTEAAPDDGYHSMPRDLLRREADLFKPAGDTSAPGTVLFWLLASTRSG